MLDQNIATILAAIVGGILTIMGGFLATYFAQRLAKRSENQKILVDRAEKLYLLISLLVNNVYNNSGDEERYEDIKAYLHSKGMLQTLDMYREIEMLVFLHFPSLKGNLDEFTKANRDLYNYFTSHSDDNKPIFAEVHELRGKLFPAHIKFQSAIIALLKKQGFS